MYVIMEAGGDYYVLIDNGLFYAFVGGPMSLAEAFALVESLEEEQSSAPGF